MGGQVGDTGELTGGGQLWRVANTQKSGNTWLHFSWRGENFPAMPAMKVVLRVDARAATPSSAITPSRICCTGRCTKS
jgi:alanyl-tRNA synthetase